MLKKIDVKKSKIFGDNENASDNLKLGIRGYFCHYSNFENYVEGELEGLTYSEYMTTEEDHDGDNVYQWYDYFIPEDKVVFKEDKEKKLRPYKTLGEFPVGLGSVLTYRSKSEQSVHILTCVESIATQDNDLVFVCLGGLRFTPLVLLKDYEYLNAARNGWLPFGVER